MVTLRRVFGFVRKHIAGVEIPQTNAVATIPNAVTLSGIVLAIALPLQIYSGRGLVLAPITCALAFLSDVPDGYLARKLGQGSVWGTRLDSIRDCACQFASLMALFFLASPGDEQNLIKSVWWPLAVVWIGSFYGAVQGEERESHFAEKLRMLAFGILTFLALVESYWLGQEYGIRQTAVPFISAAVVASFSNMFIFPRLRRD